MKKVYYFSESELKYVQIKRYNLKLILLLIAPILMVLLFNFTGRKFFSPDRIIDNNSINNENDKSYVKKQLTSLLTRYKQLQGQLKNLVQQDNDLRTTANLQPVDEESILGTGGGLDNFIFDNKNTETKDLDEISDMLDNFSTRIVYEETQYKEISNKLKQNNSLFQAMPALKPCTGSLAASGFGMRMHPILKVRRMHYGLDIITNTGTPVHAAGKGIVTFCGKRGGYGNEIEINHGFGYQTVYGHLSKILVRQGQSVKRGDVIAESGNTGLSTGPHLHYEVHHDGMKIDPADYFFDDLALFEK